MQNGPGPKHGLANSSVQCKFASLIEDESFELSVWLCEMASLKLWSPLLDDKSPRQLFRILIV